jgi:hypothetical protein
VAGLAVVLFMVSGPLRRRKVKPGRDKRAAEPGSGTAGAVTASQQTTGGQLATRPASPVPAKAPAKARKAKDDDDDDLGDVADILRRHGIT